MRDAGKRGYERETGKRVHAGDAGNPIQWRKPLALLTALALCAAAAAAVSPPAEEEPGWQPRVEGLASPDILFGNSAADAVETGTVDARETGIADARETGIADARESGSADARETGIADAKETGSGDVRETGEETGTRRGGTAEAGTFAEAGDGAESGDGLSDTVLFALTEEAAALSAPVSEEEAALAFDPEHPDAQAWGGTPETAEENPVPAETGEGTASPSDSALSPPETDSPAETAPRLETLPEVEALLAGPDDETPSGAAGPDDGGVWEPEELTDRDIKKEEKLEQLIRQVTTEPVRLETLEFADVEAIARAGNLTVLGLEETLDSLESLDYDKMLDNLRDALNGMSRGQDMIQSQVSALQRMDAMAGAAAAIGASSTLSSLQSSYNSLYQQFESIYKGDMQRSNRDVARQLRNTMDQVVMGTEALYISLCALETQAGALDRQLSALDRTVEEMELRRQLGQISDLQLGEVRAGRSALKSGAETLGMNLRTLKMQLENMLGAVPTGTIALGELPAVTRAQIDAMDPEADLLAAKEKSYELYAAARTLEDQQETYRDATRSVAQQRTAAYQQAVHTWNANQNTYNATVRGYELRFRTLCEQVRDYYQVWNAARTALAQENKSFQAAQLKYNQGNISKNALLTAKDDLQAAMEKVRSAANDLFSAYNNYCWAVQHGILN